MNPHDKLASFKEQLRSYRSDPVAFCRGVLDFEPHDGQRQWLSNSTKSENALTTGNRWGKSHIAAAQLVYRCAYRIGWTPAIRDAMARKHEPFRAVNVALSADQSKLVWHKALSMLQSPKASWLVKRVLQTPFPTIEFANGATLEARSTAREGVYLLGHDYDYCNWDEAAFEPKYERIRDNVLRMRLVDRGGTLTHTSTGNGRNSYGLYFLKGLEGKDPNLYAQSGPTTENPNIDQERVSLNAARMSTAMRQQNIEGAIIDGGGDFFTLEDLNAAYDEDLTAISRVLRVDDEEQEAHVALYPDDKPWRDKYPSHKYLHGWDLADKKDWTVGWTADVSTSPPTIVEFERFHKRGWEYVYARIRERHRRYGSSRATKIDSTGLGDVVEHDLKDIQVEGINFAGGRKDAMLANLQTIFSLRGLKMPMIRVAHNELAFYERDDDDLDTDCVMGLAVLGWWLKRANNYVYVGEVDY